MKEFLKILKKHTILLFCIVLLLLQNRWLALSDYGATIDYLGKKACPWIFCLITLISGVLFFYDVFIGITAKSSQKTWNKVQKELMVGVECAIKTHISDDGASLYYDCQCFLLSDESGSTGRVLLDKLCKQFDKEDDLQKERISYLFLAHRSNKSVAEFASTPQGEKFFRKCIKCSNEILRRRTYVDEQKEISEDDFNRVINEFLHFSLLCNTINTNEKIDYIRKVLSWVRTELRKRSAIKVLDIQMFMMALAKLEKNLSYHNVGDKIINRYISKIKKSWRFRRMYWNANYRLWANTSFETSKDRMNDSGFLVAHIWKFGLFYRSILWLIVEIRLCKYKWYYHKSHKNAIAILIMAAPLGNILPTEVDYTDKILTVVKAIGGKE